ncbi:MAG: signal peptidase I, partial [Marinicaulis sp.]|nr:signal peptidase I [Marinicaulis sp.]
MSVSTDSSSNGDEENSKAKVADRPMTAAEEMWDLIKTVVIAVSIALVLRIVLFQPFNIPSGSMK